MIDICLMRAKGIAAKDGKDLSLVIDLIDRYDVVTGFTAMERLTGWHAAHHGAVHRTPRDSVRCLAAGKSHISDTLSGRGASSWFSYHGVLGGVSYSRAKVID